MTDINQKNIRPYKKEAAAHIKKLLNGELSFKVNCKNCTYSEGSLSISIKDYYNLDESTQIKYKNELLDLMKSMNMVRYWKPWMKAISTYADRSDFQDGQIPSVQWIDDSNEVY